VPDKVELVVEEMTVVVVVVVEAVEVVVAACREMDVVGDRVVAEVVGSAEPLQAAATRATIRTRERMGAECRSRPAKGE
jgi:hypothetical protein